MLACLGGHKSIAILLLEKGADNQLHNKVSLCIVMYTILHKEKNCIMYFYKSSTVSIMIHLLMISLKLIYFITIIGTGNKRMYQILQINKNTLVCFFMKIQVSKKCGLVISSNKTYNTLATYLFVK